MYRCRSLKYFSMVHIPVFLSLTDVRKRHFSINRTLLICFFGPDGSGKSTLANLFRNYLFLHGVYAYISWFRGSHILASVLARVISRFKAFRGYNNPYYMIELPPKLRSLWVIVEFSSLLPHYFLRKFLFSFRPVIGDRGLLDFIVWIIVTLDHKKFLSSILGRFLARLASKDVNIYITAHPAVLRARAVNTPPGFLEKELRCYNVLARYYARCVIDTTDRKPWESLEKLVKCIRELSKK